MKHRLVNGVPIPVIGQGGMGLGGYFEMDAGQDQVGLKALAVGLEHGATFLDTAESYGAGHSEELIGLAVKGLRSKVFLATKFLPEHSRYEEVLAAAEGSLRRLRTDYIDLYQVHWPNSNVPLAETMGALDDLVTVGKVRMIGVCNFSLDELKEAQKRAETRISFIQAEYNLFDRGIESDLLPYCRENGILVLAYSPVDQGLRHFSPSQKEYLSAMGRKYGRSSVQVMLNWLVSSGGVTAIPQTNNPAHARENALAADFTLSTEDVRALNQLFPQKPAYIAPRTISPVGRLDRPGRKIYSTKKEALDNKFDLTPSPAQLARDMMTDPRIKPVRVAETGPGAYELLEGRVRYWAWVIAFGEDEPIPCLVKRI